MHALTFAFRGLAGSEGHFSLFGWRRDLRVAIDTLDHLAEVEPNLDVLELETALERLEEIDERAVRVVELRWFAGLSVVETAEVLATSPATVKRDWAMAKAWLWRQLQGDDRSTK